MTSPYTSQPLDALLAAQTAVGFALGAIVWHQRIRPRLAALLLLLAIAAAVVAPVDRDLWTGIGLTVGANHTKHVLKLALGLVVVGVLLTRRPVLSLLVLLASAGLWKLTSYIQESDAWLAAVHLSFYGMVVGAFWRPRPGVPAREAAPITQRVWVDDVVFLLAGIIAGAVVATVVLHRWTNSGDEWADTYQAALLAKFRAYGEVPHCSDAFRTFWVFHVSGRAFAQYTPGWPLFMAPFMWISAPWLAGPVALGLLAAGICRLGRRAASAAAAAGVPLSSSEIRVAGRFAAAAALLSATVLINGGSRYPHVFVAATFVWSVESLCAISFEDARRQTQVLWGAVLGLAASLMLAARPADGATLGIGLASYFVYAAVRRRIAWRAALAATVAFCAVGGLSLVIMRLQLGRWFTTGYSLMASYYPFFMVKYSIPDAASFRWGVPLDTGSYCWWPCSPAVGLAGLMLLRGRSRGIFFIFALSYIPFCTLYTLLELGRGWDLGYGPRYSFPLLVPMAVGTGVALARLWTTARSRGVSLPALQLGGPVAVALASALLAVLRIAPLIYPPTYADVQLHNRLHEGIAQSNLHNAIVLAGPAMSNTDPKDLPENLPLDLYPNQDVLIANDSESEAVECIRERFPNRRLYRAFPGNPGINFSPY